MKTVQVTQFVKARVWVNESATVGFVAEGILKASVRANPSESNGSHIVGVEAMIPRGGMVEYGLIGFQFVPDKLDRLQCEVGYSSMNGPSWPDALAAELDDVRLGLPREYSSAVVAALSSACEGRMPSGVIRIMDAAHGLVGSSPNVFGRLTTAAVELALLVGAELPDDQVVKILRGILMG